MFFENFRTGKNFDSQCYDLKDSYYKACFVIFLPSVRRRVLLLFDCLICSYDGDDDTCSSYASPYRSLLSAASLAASVKVNSVVRPALNPALSAQLNISMLQVKFSNHLHAIGQGKMSGIHL